MKKIFFIILVILNKNVYGKAILDLAPFSFDYENYDSIESEKYCYSDICKKEANKIGYLNEKASPCDNFFDYTCGFSDDNYLIGLNKRVVKIIENSVFSLNVSSNDTQPIRNIKLFYEQCTKREMDFFEDFFEFVKNNLNGWPLLGIQSLNNLTTDQKILNLFKVGVNPFFKIDVETDIYDPKKYTIWLKPSDSLRLRVNDPKNQKHVIVIILALMKTYSQVNITSNILNETASIIRIIKSLYNLNQKKKVEAPIIKTKISNLSSLIHGFNWETFIIDNVFNKTFNKSISLNETILVDNVELIQSIINLINNESKSNTRNFDNFLVWELLDNLNEIMILFGDLKQDEIDINSINYEACSQYIFKHFNPALSKFYIEKYFNKSLIKEVQILLENLKYEYELFINQSTWMDDESKSFSIKRIKNLEFKIGYPDYIFNDTLLEEAYSIYNFENGSFLKNEFLRRFNDIKMAFELLNEERVKKFWQMGPSLPNAAFSVLTHEIYIPAGIIQSPLYDTENLMLFNYARFGFILAHEIAHAFSLGKLFDENGVYIKNNTLKFYKNYLDLADCFIENFKNYSVIYDSTSEYEKLNTINTLEENISDNIGFKIAFNAYKKWENRNGGDKILPGINLSNYQLFFIGYSQMFCDFDQIKSFYDLPHSPSHVRINAITQHYQEFSDVFNCDINPDFKQCYIL